MSEYEYPLVSVGVPLYNEERFVRETLQSLLDQDYPNIEILISDNASSDRTLAICKEVVADKNNIKIHCFEKNKGAIENFRYVLQNTNGKYFLWASGHDLWSSNYISANVTQLESNPEGVISYGSSLWVDEYGRELEVCLGYTDTSGMNAIARFFTVYWGNMNPILGLIRKSALDSSCILRSMVGADLIMLTELSLQGDFLHENKTHWWRRDFRNEVSHEEKLQRYRSSEYLLTRSIFVRLFPMFRLPFELVITVVKSNLTIAEKCSVVIALIASMPVRYFVGKRSNDI